MRILGLVCGLALAGFAGLASAQTAQIGGRAFTDNNADGVFNGADAGLGGVTITLNIYNNTNDGLGRPNYVFLATQTTAGGTGAYNFTLLAAGSYQVVATTPGSNALTTHNQPIYFTITGAQVVTGVDFGFATGAVLQIQPISWNTIGVDSVAAQYQGGAGPDTFLYGVRVTNIGASGTASGVTASWAWTNGNTSYSSPGNVANGTPTTGQDDKYINLVDIDPTAGTSYLTSLPQFGAPTVNLTPGQFQDFYFDIKISRLNDPTGGGSHPHIARAFQVTTTATGLGNQSTPAGHELYIEALQSQNRNSVTSIQGPTVATVGSVVQYVVSSATSASYLEITSELLFPTQYFEIISISQAYSNPFSQGTTTYADACGWQNDPTQTATYENNAACIGYDAPPVGPGTDPTYPIGCTLPNNPCSSTGKTGGPVQATYTVRILRTPQSLGDTNPVHLVALIYDKSGSSFHYNSNLGDCTMGDCLDVTITTDPIICGRVFFDRNSNGVYNSSSEPGLQNVQVSVTDLAVGENPTDDATNLGMVGDGATADFCGTLSFTTAANTPNTVKLSDGVQMVMDNGAGALTGNVAGAPFIVCTSGQAGNTINYTTGKFQVKFASAPPNGAKIMATYTKRVQSPILTDINGIYQAISKQGPTKIQVIGGLPTGFSLTTGPLAVTNEVIGSGAGGVATICGRTTKAPIITPGGSPVFTITDGVSTFTDNGAGGFTGPTVAAPYPLPSACSNVKGNTFDAMSGYFSVTFNTAAGANNIKASYQTPNDTQTLLGTNGAKTMYADIGYSFPDCNGNGIPDSLDIASGESKDVCNGGVAGSDGIPDECQHGEWHLHQPPTSVDCAFCCDNDAILCGTSVVNTYTNPPDPAVVDGLTQNQGQVLAENFKTGSTGLDLREIHWFGFFGGDNTSVGKKFTIMVLNDASGLPGTSIADADGTKTGLTTVLSSPTAGTDVLCVKTGLKKFSVYDMYEMTYYCATNTNQGGGQISLSANTTYWIEIFEQQAGPTIQGGNITGKGDLGNSFVWASCDAPDTHISGTAPGLVNMAVSINGGSWALSGFNLALELYAAANSFASASLCAEGTPLAGDPSPAPTPCPGEVLNVDFSNNAQDWASGIALGQGSTSLGSSGLCMSVPAAGDNIVGWVSPEAYIQLVDNSVYRARLAVTTDQSQADAIPLWTVSYDNFNGFGAGGNTYGGLAWIMDVAGGANGIGRPNGRSSYDIFFAPNALLAPQWEAAFSPGSDATNDIRLAVRVLDLASASYGAQLDSGTICVSSLKVDRFALSDLPVDSLVYYTPISNQTHAASAIGQSPLEASIDDASNIANYRLRAPFDRATLIPAEADKKVDGKWTYPSLYPVVWKTNTLYMVSADIQASADTGDSDPVDLLMINIDTATQELGQINYTTRGSANNMDRYASPRLASSVGGPQTYVGFFYGQNATAATLDGADGLRPMVDLIHFPLLRGSFANSDGLQVLGLSVTTLQVP